MIKEDYCSYEVSKLLKEKGFDGEFATHMFYSEFDEEIHPIMEIGLVNDEDIYFAPTHQMAMKWFREKHNIHISLWIYGDHYNFSIHEFPESTDLSIEEDLDKQHEIKAASYEDATEAALKYCLTELI